MLDAGRAPDVHGGVIVFHDHADPGLRYVTAEAPRIERDPDPRISLVLFRGVESRGGLLQLESTLTPTEEQLEELRDGSAARGSVVRLAAPDWRRGSVEVAGWLDADEMKPMSLALGTPSVIGTPRVLLAARLDHAGAALAHASLRGDALPTALLWRLETLGLAGPLGVEVEADLQAIHDRLMAEGALTVPIGRARLAKTWEEFVSDNLVRVRSVDESGDLESNRGEALRRMGEELTAAMFAPFPPAERPPMLEDESIAPIELSFRLTLRREELAQTRKWSFRERRAISVTHYAAAGLVDFLGGRPLDQHVVFIDLGESSTREVVVRTSPDLASLGLSALEVDLDFDGSGTADQTLVLTDDALERRLTISRKDGDVLLYRARARFDPLKTRAADAETEWLEAAGDFVFVPTGSLFPSRTLTLLTGSAEMDWINHVEVSVSAPGEPERTVVLTQEQRLVDVSFPGAGDGPLRVSADWRGGEGEPELAVDDFTTNEDVVILDSPFDSSIQITVVPLRPPEALSLSLELRYSHGDFFQERLMEWDSSDTEPRETGLRRPKGGPRQYEFRQTVLNSDGVLAQGDWEQTESSVVVAGARGLVEVYRSQFIALGGGPAGRGSLAIEFTLESGERRTSAVLEGTDDTAVLRLIVPEGDPPPHASAREFRTSGEIVETDWPEHEQVYPLLPLPRQE